MKNELKTILVDDERLARKELRSLLACFSAIKIVGEAESLAQAIRLIESEKPDVVFLDVQLAGETGFDLLEQVSGGFKTIFVTAFDAFAIKAFEVNALDYLLKPVNPERLKQTIERLLTNEKVENPVLPELRPLAFDDRLFLELGERSVFLKVNTISHISAASDYSEVYTINKQKLLTEKPLREWEARLPAKYFARIHRGVIVNLEYVERVEVWSNRIYLYLQNKHQPLAVSRRYATRLKEKFG